MRVIVKWMLVGALLIGQMPVSVFAQSSSTQQVMPTGRYTIEQEVLKPDSDEDSSAGKFLQKESLLEVTEESLKLTLTYTAGSLMSNVKIRVNGEDVDFDQEVKGSGMASTLALTVELSDLSDEISMDMTIMGTMNHSVRMILKDETLKVLNQDAPEEDKDEPEDSGDNPSDSSDENESVDTGNDSSGSDNGGSSDETLPGNDGIQDSGTSGEVNEGQPGTQTIYYTIEQNVYQPGTTQSSMAGDFLQSESRLKETDGKKELTLTFGMGNLISGIRVRINGKEVPVKQHLAGEGDAATLALTFEIESLEDQISMDMTIMGFMKQSVDIVLKPETLKQISEDVALEEENKQPVAPTAGNQTSSIMIDSQPTDTKAAPSVKESQLVSVSNLVEGQTYLIKNDVYSSVSVPRQALNPTSYVEVKGGAYYVTFGFGLMDYMNNLRLSINGSNVSYQTLSSSATTLELKFKMNTLTDKIMITAYVPAISRDVTFEVKLLTNAIYTLSEGTATQTLAVNTVLPLSLGEEEAEEVADELEVTDYLIRYSIKNEVLSDSESGLSMARKYLNEDSVLEEVDGVLYLSLTLTGTDMMQNIRFKVNGELVDHELIFDDTENHCKTYRFMIGSVEDEIEATMYIIPGGRDISFGIRLLKETQTLLSEEGVENVNFDAETVQLLAEEPEVAEVKESRSKVMLITVVAIGSLGVISGVGSYLLHLKKKNKTKA